MQWTFTDCAYKASIQWFFNISFPLFSQTLENYTILRKKYCTVHQCENVIVSDIETL